MTDFLHKWAESHNWEHSIDEVGDVIVQIAATSPELNNAPIVCLQAHMDMVCEKGFWHDFFFDMIFFWHDFLFFDKSKEKGKEIDFENDPIELMRSEDGKWLKANGTTLGGDDGIGVAFAMAIAENEDKKFVHGPLEILITVDEGLVFSKKIINIKKSH